jgi:hypothetical protein
LSLPDHVLDVTDCSRKGFAQNLGP